MFYMKLLFTFFILFISLYTTAQNYNQLLLRKNGIAIKRFTEGSTIHLKSKLGLEYTGTIYLIQNDSIYFAGNGIHIRDIGAVYKKVKSRTPIVPFGKEAFLYANLGIPLFVTGLLISGEPLATALSVGVGIVYAPLLLYNVKRLVFNVNRQYKLGNKFDLLVLDIHPAEKVPQKNQ